MLDVTDIKHVTSSNTLKLTWRVACDTMYIEIRELRILSDGQRIRQLQTPY